MVVALESGLHHCGEVARLFTCLVDGNAEGGQSRKVHEQVVDEVFELSVILATDD